AAEVQGGDGIDQGQFVFQGAAVTFSIADNLAGVVTVNGTKISGIEQLVNFTAGRFDDHITGGAYADMVDGLDGNDLLSGEAGDDVLLGGAGNDLLVGGAGTDTLIGGVGDDVLWADAIGVTPGLARGAAASAGDLLDGGDGADVLHAAAGATITGGSGRDTIVLDAADGDVRILDFAAGAGGDVIEISAFAAGGDPFASGRLRLEQGENGTTLVFDADGVGGAAGTALAFLGNVAPESLSAANFAAKSADGAPIPVDPTRRVITGTDRSDILTGTDKADIIRGLDGADLISGKAGDDQIDGGDGWDLLFGDAGDDLILGGEGWDALTGGAGRDRLEGGAGNDVLSGGEGDDWLSGGAGSDLIDGGSGFDIVSYADARQGVSASLGNGQGSGGDAAGDRYLFVEALEGSGFADRLSGGNGDDTLLGLGGDDQLDGGNGDDRLDGGAGNDRLDGGNHADVLNGGAGRDVLNGGNHRDVLNGGTGDDVLTGGNQEDVFAFSDGSGHDTITDFRRGQDKIDLSGMDANLLGEGHQGFAWIGSSAFTGAAGELRAFSAGGSAFLAGDVNGDAVADFTIMTGSTQILTSDIIFA
ncbi:calcium-binding protein, partial [Sphingomonas parva]